MVGAKDPEFLVLKPGVGWLPESELQDVLGAVVKNPLSPLADSYPKVPEKYMGRKPMEDEYDGFILGKEQLSSSNFEVEVRGLGKLRWAKSSGQNIDLSGKKILIRRMRRHDEYWRKMTAEDRDFQAYVPSWLRKRHLMKRRNIVCLVVGVLMCQDVLVSASEDQSRELIAGGEVPLGTIVEDTAAAHGAFMPTGGAGDVSTGASSTLVKHVYFQARGERSRIFALELKAVSPKLELAGDMPKLERRLGAGDEEKLVLDEITAADWDDIVDYDERVEAGSDG